MEPTGRIVRMTPDPSNRNETDPEVQLFPTYGYPIARGTVWRIHIQGRICQPVRLSFGKRLMLRGLIRALDIPPDVAASELFQSRVRGFLVAPVRGSRIQLHVGEHPFVLRGKSKRSGLFLSKLDLPATQLSHYRTHGLHPNSLQKDAPECMQRWDIGLGPVASQIFLAQTRGVSVITDIDDTIKLTEVSSRRRMLQRTFAETFAPIEGMAAVYQQWAQCGALFHYVSSSPWQIYSAVDEFLTREAFPPGSMHLKWFQLRDEILKRWQITRRKSKFGVIRTLIERMPNRTFVLVGDSGERDPEIYAKLAARFPSQIVRICIRQIDATPLDARRLARIYRRFGMTVPIQVFVSPQQLGPLTANGLLPGKHFT